MSNAGTFELFARLALSLGVVIGVMWLVSTVLRRRGIGPAPRRRTRAVEVELLARKPLGRNASIAVVRAAGQSMVIGITEHQVTKLADAEIEEIDLETMDAQGTAHPVGPVGPSSAWKAMLEQVRERTVRR
ncbi:MAG: FliO/MopB family protein [Actinomycetota bacterium]